MNAITPTQRLLFAGHIWLTGASLRAALAYLGPLEHAHECAALDWCAFFANKPGRFRPLRNWLCRVPDWALQEIMAELGPF